MKRILSTVLVLLVALTSMADNASEARRVLDKAASKINATSGAQANFLLSSDKLGHAQGTIAVKGSKFFATTSDATVWYDGKTQWTYVKNTDEVNISSPTAAQQAQMNPLTFVNLYKKGYRLSMTSTSGNYEVHLVAEDKSATIEEMYVVVSASTYMPTQVRLLRSDGWLTINISNLLSKPQSDSTFVFNSKDFPTAEVVDLR